LPVGGSCFTHRADAAAVITRAHRLCAGCLGVRSARQTDNYPHEKSWQGRFNVPIIWLAMANLYYNDRLIIAYASLNQSDKQWSAGAEITWRRDGHRQSHSIGGLSERFKTSEDAERFVVNLAKAWVDAHP